MKSSSRVGEEDSERSDTRGDRRVLAAPTAPRTPRGRVGSMRVRRALSWVVGALAVAAFTPSGVAGEALQAQRNEKTEKRQEDEVIVDSTVAGDAAAAHSAPEDPVASWEVATDGSAVKVDNQVVQAVDSNPEEEDVVWRLVVNEEDGGVTIDKVLASHREQTSGNNGETQSDDIIHVEEVLQYVEDLNENELEEVDVPLLLEPSEAFLNLEDRVHDEGYTPELIAELQKMKAQRSDSNDVDIDSSDWAFAVTKLAYMSLFEPAAAETSEKTFSDALRDLQIAADAGVSSAQGVVAMLELLDVSMPRHATEETKSRDPITREERHARADQTLVDLARAEDFMATLAVGYGLLSGRMRLPLNDSSDGSEASTAELTCNAALPFYHTSAESNVHTIADEGGERPVEVVRLSDELFGPNGGSFFDDYVFGEPLHDENEAVHELEYYRTIANNPMDEQYPEAMQRLGEIHFFGEPAANVAPDHVRAAEYFREAANAGDPLGQANYGMLLANGMGVDQNVPQAVVYFERAAAQGEAFAFHGLGVLHFTGTGVPQNVTLALEYFEEAIALGFAESHSFLGSAYLNGDGGVTVDHDLAFQHFQAAVDGTGGQSSQPLFNLAVMHYRGVGTPQSCTAALPLFRSVALHPDLLSGLPFSLVKAYECYQQGDFLRAYLHYRLVAQLGDEDAQCNAAFLLEHHGASIFRWRWLTAQWKDTESSVLPLREAFALYSQAAALNDSEAVRKTGTCFHEPWDGVCIRNRTRALELYQLAAELGDAQAGYNCGLMLLTGDGVPQDLEAARSFYADCSKAGFPMNVPCSLALVGLDVVAALQSFLEQF